MAAIKLTSGGFQLIPEGVTIFKITEAEYDQDFGKIEVKLQTKAGISHNERFMILTNTGEVNEKALAAFSIFAKNVMNDFTLDEIDHTDMVGRFVQAKVEHYEYESKKEPGKMYKSARLKDYAPAAGFAAAQEVDVDDFLNS